MAINGVENQPDGSQEQKKQLLLCNIEILMRFFKILRVLRFVDDPTTWKKNLGFEVMNYYEIVDFNFSHINPSNVAELIEQTRGIDDADAFFKSFLTNLINK